MAGKIQVSVFGCLFFLSMLIAPFPFCCCFGTALWFDKRGNWHVIFHVYALEAFKTGIEKYSGHAYSRNGLDWTFSDVEPFGGTVQYTDGTNQSFATRERPQLTFADDDTSRTTPIGMTSSVSSQPLGPWCDQCHEGACSQCKITPGRDWTYTIFQAFSK